MEDLEIKDLFEGIYNNKRVLVTGHTGFKGSWLIFWLEKMGARVVGISLGEISRPSHYSLNKKGHISVYKDILDKKALKAAVKKYKPEIIFHLAAQSLVRESYRNPVLTYETNITGTLNLLEAARATPSVRAIINVTTDKVYENTERNIAYKETDRLGGYDLYSSSKACSEILSDSYRRAFLKESKVLLATARAGNVIGGGDWAIDRLIPDLIKSAVKNEITKIRNPNSIRPWQHVLEPLSGYLLLGQYLLKGDREFAASWNFGPATTDCISVKSVLKQMQKHWNAINYKDENSDPGMHEAALLKLNCKKAGNKLKWKPVWSNEKAIERTVSWYKSYYINNKVNTASDLNAYIRDAVSQKLIWTR